MGLWVVLVWDRCGEPSQALRASSPGGRAKGLVGIDGWSVKFRFVGMLEVCTQALPLPPGEVPPEGRGRGIVQTVGGGMQFRMKNRYGGSMDSLWMESVR